MLLPEPVRLLLMRARLAVWVRAGVDAVQFWDEARLVHLVDDIDDHPVLRL